MWENLIDALNTNVRLYIALIIVRKNRLSVDRLIDSWINYYIYDT